MLHFASLFFSFSCFAAHIYALPPRSGEVWETRQWSPNYSLGQAFAFLHTLTTPKGQYSCFDTPNFPSVGFSECRATFDDLLRSPEAFTPHRYQGTPMKPEVLRNGPCTVLLGTTLSGSVVDISLQQIVSDGRDLLTACRKHSRGGINYIAPERRWYVAIRGGKAAGLSMQGLRNGTVS